MTVREELHSLIAALPEDALPAVRRFLHSVVATSQDVLGRFFGGGYGG